MLTQLDKYLKTLDRTPTLVFTRIRAAESRRIRGKVSGMANGRLTDNTERVEVESKVGVEAELYKLSPTAQVLLKKFLNELDESTLSLMKVENFPHEIWRNIVGYEGLYQVSNFGCIKNFSFNREKILRPSSSQKGYIQVSLSKKGRKRNWSVNILVAKAFHAR